jgi:hypothetical protein
MLVYITLVFTILLSSCGFLPDSYMYVSEERSESRSEISGKYALSGLSLSEDWEIGLYATDSEELLSSGAFDWEKGTFKISLKNLTLDDTKTYMIKMTNGSDQILRILTDHSAQNLDATSTLISYLAEQEDIRADRKELHTFINQLQEQMAGESRKVAIFDRLSKDSRFSAQFQILFGRDVAALRELPPRLIRLDLPRILSEGAEHRVSLLASHWHPEYEVAYLIQLADKTIADKANFIIRPTANDQGAKILKLYLGQKDPNGDLDPKKSMVIREYEVRIQDSIPAQAPRFVIQGTPSYVSSRDLTLEITTDTFMKACESFSHFAITENTTFVPPLMSFIHTCDTPALQEMSYRLATALDGLKTLRIYAMDSGGNISPSSTPVAVILDTAPPTGTVNAFTTTQKGGSSVSLSYNIQDLGIGLQSLALERSDDDGATFIHTADLDITQSSYNITHEAADRAAVIYRVIATDALGQVSTITQSASFAIDATAPLAPSVTRHSAAVSNATLVTITAANCDDTTQILVQEAASAPNGSEAGWQNCSTTAGDLSHTLSNTNFGVKTLYVWAKDAAGNISDSASISMTLDQDAPLISMTSLDLYYNSGANIPLQWQLTESLATSSEEFTISYSSDGGSSWNSIASAASGNGALTNQSFSTSVSLPAVHGGQYRLRVSLRDQAGNEGHATSSSFTVDTAVPAITGVSLGNGSGFTATPVVQGAVSVHHTGPSAVSWIRYSESNVYADDSWIPYASSINVRLSAVSGAKDVYFWVKNDAGSISTVHAQSITLDYGTPPTARFLSPGNNSSYQEGDSVPISWECQSSVGLAEFPIKTLEYTLDDGVSFHSIAQNLSNNTSATEGSYSWTVPAQVGTSPFRFKLVCQAVSEVQASVLSPYINTPDWSLFTGGYWDMETNVSASLANVGGASEAVGVMGDHLGNAYYRRGHGIMKLNSITGLISDWAGNRSQSGCPSDLSLDLKSIRFNAPLLLGVRDQGREILVLTCNSVFSIDTVQQSMSLVKSFAGYTVSSQRMFLSATHAFLFIHANRLYKVDLSTVDAPIQHIYGNGSCVPRADLQVGADALSQSMIGSQNTTACGGGNYFIAASANLDKIWINPHHGTNAMRIDKNDDIYVIGNKTLNWDLAGYMRCMGVASQANKVYCSPRHTGRGILIFNTSSESWTTRSLPFENNVSSGFLSLGIAGSHLLAHYSLNNLSLAELNASDDNITFTTLAGRPLTSFGNAEPLNMHAFTNVNEIKYLPSTQHLWMFSNGHHRIIDIGASTSWTIYETNIYNGGGSAALNPSGSIIGRWVGCARAQISFINVTGATSNLNGFFLSGPCNTSGTSYHLIDGESPGVSFFSQAELTSSAPLAVHSNGRAYFAARKSDGQHAMLFSSDKTILHRIAGQQGASLYNAADHGGSARDADLTRINMIQENADGDLLILDHHRLRKITISTESADPKIYDIFDFATLAHYSVTAYGSVHYNEATQTLYVFDSSTLTLKKAHPTNGFHAYSTAGTTLGSHSRITGSASDIFLLDPPRQRVLRFNP